MRFGFAHRLPEGESLIWIVLAASYFGLAVWVGKRMRDAEKGHAACGKCGLSSEMCARFGCNSTPKS